MEHSTHNTTTQLLIILRLTLLVMINLITLQPTSIFAAQTQLTIYNKHIEHISITKDKTTVHIDKTVSLYSDKRNVYLPADNTDITYVCPYSPASRRTQLEEIKNTLKIEAVYPRKNSDISYEIKNAGDCIAIKYPYMEKLRVGEKLKFKLQFTLRSVNLKTPPLELNIQHALQGKQLQQGDYIIKLTYTKEAQITVPAGINIFDLTAPSEVHVPKATTTKSTNPYTYNIPHGVLSKHNASLVIGNQIVTEYLINIQLKQTGILNKLSKINTPLPLDAESYGQKSFVDIQSYKLIQNGTIRVTPNGYLNITTPSSHQFRTIVITKPTTTPYISSTLRKAKVKETPNDIYTKWLNPELYPTQSPMVHDILKRIPESPYILENVINIVQKVIDILEYDKNFIKTPRDRLSVQEAILAGKGVCTEYSDLTITLLQARGIAARPAYGYLLYTSDFAGANLGDYGHQWVEVYFPKIGWIPIDPTLAETVPNYINMPMAYLFITNKNSALTTYCVGFLNSCKNTAIKTKLRKISTLETFQNKLMPITSIIAVDSEQSTTPTPTTVHSTDLLKIVSQLITPVVELIPLQIWWSLPIIALLSIIYMTGGRINKKARQAIVDPSDRNSHS